MGVPKTPAGLGDARDGLGKLPHDFRIFRAGEIKAIGSRQRLRAGTDQVAAAFRDCVRGSLTRIKITKERVPIQAHCQGAATFFQSDHGGVAARTHHGVGAHLIVVLAVHPTSTAQLGRARHT